MREEKSMKLYNSITNVKDEFIEELNYMTRENKPARRFGYQLSYILAAAILALALMGAGIAAVLYGDSIQNWFAHQWEAITGQVMDEGQIAVIDHLSQEIKASQTINDVTVTVDSATVGDGTFYLLLRVEGLRLSQKYSYAFDVVDMEVEPNPLVDSGGLGGYSFQYQGLDGDGAAIILMNYNYASRDGYIEDTRPLKVTLTLKDFVNIAHTTDQKILAEGEWTYVFSIDRTEVPKAISFPDTEIMVMDRDTQKEVAILIKNIQLTNTGIRFQFDKYEGVLAIFDNLKLILKNGVEVRAKSGVGSPIESGTAEYYSVQWHFPVDLNEIAYIQIGSSRISLEESLK